MKVVQNDTFKFGGERVKNVLHSLGSGETQSYSASHQTPTLYAAFLNLAISTLSCSF